MALRGNVIGKQSQHEHAALIYANSFNGITPGGMPEKAKDWVMEGRGVATCGDGCLSLRSEVFTVPRASDGHFNFWLNREFPADVSIEWEFRYAAPGDQGLAIVMWAARGRKGESIFDPDLPTRRGEVMSDLHSGAIHCYHTSYLARGRKVANLRKNHGFHLLASGPDLSCFSRPDEWHRMRIEQVRDRITLLVDGRILYRHLDDGSQGGPPIRSGGCFGFRQQNNLYRGDYRNLKICALRPPE